MAITAKPYGEFLKDRLTGGTYSVLTTTIKVALLSNSYTPDLDTHVSYADVIAAEVTGAGYTAGGGTLANKSIAFDTVTDKAALMADPVDWATLTATFRYAVLYRGNTTNATSTLIGLVDFGTDRVYSNEPFQLTATTGFVTLTAA